MKNVTGGTLLEFLTGKEEGPSLYFLLRSKSILPKHRYPKVSLAQFLLPPFSSPTFIFLSLN